MDQIHLPDPMLNDIKELQIANFQLHEELLEMESRLKCMHCKEAKCSEKEREYKAD